MIMDIDVRVAAIVLGIIGIALGFLPGVPLLGVSIGLTLAGGVIVRDKQGAYTGVGNLGVLLAVVGGLVCILLPAWITYVIR